MGLTYTEVELLRADDLALERAGYLSADQVNRIRVLTLVDSGASMLTLSRSLSQRLKLAKVDEVDAELANGDVMRADVVGPVEVRFQNRKTVVNASCGRGRYGCAVGGNSYARDGRDDGSKRESN
jgi:hypothetical protein